MSSTPTADIPTDAELVAALVAAQHPDLAGPLRLVSDGWDNQLYRLGDDHAVRIPRREVAAHLIEHEQQMLPGIAARVRARVPVPIRVGVPSAAFPFPWSIVDWIDGVDGASVAAAERSGLAEPLAAFVGELAVPTPDAPRNPVRGVPLRTRAEVVGTRLRSLSGRMEVAALEQAWREALAAPEWDGPPLLLHGDLHPGNLLLTPASGLAAVLDFGDVTSGDPATDLATAWLTFDEEARERFRAALPTPPDPATWRRARGWAVTMGTALATSSDDNPRMASLARHALDQINADD
ncbi:aminoglycoside phosphotransferase family protein [Leifsonia shinshuensis]|uniref:aminoglycoside phosphotransferase family protein n=1 Tax=Leifsonia shinshuensis TaxID=150026 RepID=UPI001F50DE8C|nr:aminoglycoside phosphotransferase family protein [Leifsonia shinshuensis]MCI0157332.1 aminoglycoside phosphotransferase family protein [Leifsonia shinshuensis]